MITIKTMKQIPTCKMVRGFRSGGARQRSHLYETSRIITGYAQILTQEARRQWLNNLWQNR